MSEPPKKLAPKEAAPLIGKTEETLRVWRRKNIGPPYVMEGGRPVYRSDLIEAGTYTVQGLQKQFPTGKNEVIDASRLSDAEQKVLEGLLSKCPPAQTLDECDDLVIAVGSDEIDVSDPVTQRVLSDLAKLARARLKA